MEQPVADDATTHTAIDEQPTSASHDVHSRLAAGDGVELAEEVRADGDERATAERAAKLLVIAGCTNAGKTTMARTLVKMFKDEGFEAHMVSQDDFFLQCDQVEKVWQRKGDDSAFYYNYDSVTAIDGAKMNARLDQLSSACDYIILEGNLLTEMKSILDRADRIVFLTINQETCRRRRNLRDYDPPDTPGYFDDVVWPAYQQHVGNALAAAREDSRISFLDVSTDTDCADDRQMIELIESLSEDVVRITWEELDVNEACRLVGSHSCGATSIFVGTTRDTFQGRVVVRLDYESYDEMAYKELRKLCSAVRTEYPTVERLVVFHRVGEVPVGETSVVIAAASPHRHDAIRATEMAIDVLKRTVPIWKKEVYDDGGCSWKENGEWRAPPSPRLPPTNGSVEERSFAEAKRTRDANRQVFWLRQMVRQMRAPGDS